LAERLEMAQAESACLPSSHREADDRPVLAIGGRAVLAVDHRDDVFDQIALVECRISTERAGALRWNPGAVAVDARPAVAQGHDDEKRLDLFLCEKIVENVVGAAVAVPRMMIVRKAVQ